MSEVYGTQAYHHITAAWRGQRRGGPPATQLIRLQHLKAKLLQVLHLDAKHSLPGFSMTKEGAALAWNCLLLQTSRVFQSALLPLYGKNIMFSLTGSQLWWTVIIGGRCRTKHCSSF